jgi:hypothetical protein
MQKEIFTNSTGMELSPMLNAVTQGAAVKIISSGAHFSPDNKYRLVLWRIWDESKPKVMYIGLNPSTANATKNDNTITKLVKVSNHNGFGGFYMLNLYSYVTPHPEELKGNWEIMDGINNKKLLEYSGMASKIVFCWGNFKEAQEKAYELKHAFQQDAWCFKQNKNGSPKHPLYCKDDSVLIPFINNKA